MRVIDNMAERMRRGLRSFLRIEQAQNNVIHITENLDFNGNAAKNRVWYRGDADELSQMYKALPGEASRMRFWAAVPTPGMEIEKNHTGLPGIIVDTLASIVVTDMNGVEVEGKSREVWGQIEKENQFKGLVEEAVNETLIVGDGAFRVSFDPEISDLPILEFIPGDKVEFVYKRGRVYEIVFRSTYNHDYKEYVLEETYGKGYVRSTLLYNGGEVPLSTVPETANLKPEITYEGKFMMAEQFMVFKSSRYEGRGGSVFDKKSDSFDNLDEAWSQWMDALRKARTKEYIPSDMLPRNPHTGEVLKPNAFDNSYIEHNSPMIEGGAPKIETVQPTVPVESYLGTYMTALDLCLQGIISPSTLGIDVKKLDNADAQREKEKATLYTRNKIVEALQETIPTLVDVAIKAYATWNRQALEDVKADLPFGEYANPSFESQVETVSKARTGQIMSIEAAVEELYGDSKEQKWKDEEVARLKEEQGVTQMDEPEINTEGVGLIAGKGDEPNLPNEQEEV